jgi:tetratricopeptide (TPR) repeat protein
VTDYSIVDTLYQEAEAFYDKGKYREAKASMTPVYAAFERLEVKDKAKGVSYLRLLSDISNVLQENDKAIEYATEVAIHALTDDDRSFAYNGLGLAYSNKGEYDKAIGYHEKSLAIKLKRLEAEHQECYRAVYSDVGASYNNIGGVYDNKGEYEKAIGYYEKSLAIQLKVLGAEHPDVGTSYNNIGLAYYNLAAVYKAKGDKATQMTYLLKAKAIFLKKLGAQHPSTKNVQSWIDGLK